MDVNDTPELHTLAAAPYGYVTDGRWVASARTLATSLDELLTLAGHLPPLAVADLTAMRCRVDDLIALERDGRYDDADAVREALTERTDRWANSDKVFAARAAALVQS